VGFFTWTFTRRIESKDLRELKNLLKVIDAELIRLKVDRREIGVTSVQFKNSFFNEQGRFHLMTAVDQGEIAIDIIKGELNYSVSTKRTSLLLIAMSLFFIALSWNYFLLGGIILSLWLLGMNLIGARMKHSKYATKLKHLIEDLN
jgi:hypothetical protein